HVSVRRPPILPFGEGRRSCYSGETSGRGTTAGVGWTQTEGTMSLEDNNAFLDSAIAAVRNGTRLTEDAEFLLDLERFGSAYALSILAQEEFAKAFLLSCVASGALPWSERVRHALRDHVCKNLTTMVLDFLCPDLDEFLRRYRADSTTDDPWKLPPPVVDAVHVLVHERFPRARRLDWLSPDDAPLDRKTIEIAGGSLDRRKQDAIYVDIDRNGQVHSSPENVSRKHALEELERAQRIGRDLRPQDGKVGPAAAIEVRRVTLLL